MLKSLECANVIKVAFPSAVHSVYTVFKLKIDVMSLRICYTFLFLREVFR